MNINEDLYSYLEQFKSISLEEIEKFALMDRVDTKYVFHIQELNQVLKELLLYYSILEINQKRISKYESLYFDTENKDLYHFHQRGKLNRYKFRIRKYVESNLNFFEIKFKNNKGRTKKSRIIVDNFNFKESSEIDIFLKHESKYSIKDLEEMIWVNYSRITLVNKKNLERVTLDLNLEFKLNELSQNLDKFVVAEVKQNKSFQSKFVEIMHKNHFREGSISKYCLGMISLFPTLKANNFKPFLININKTLKNYA
jgi:hypothetical protein